MSNIWSEGVEHLVAAFTSEGVCASFSTLTPVHGVKGSPLYYESKTTSTYPPPSTYNYNKRPSRCIKLAQKKNVMTVQPKTLEMER